MAKYVDAKDFDNSDFWEEFNQYRLMLEQWNKSHTNYHERCMTSDIKELNKPKGAKMSEFKFITINPADGKEKEFIQKVTKFMKRPCMAGEYVFEQRGHEEGDYHGLHCHGLVKYYPNLKRDLISQMKKFCDSTHINIQNCTVDDIERRRKYMSGIKKGEQKSGKVLNDVKMRMPMV